jgi:hypothetical protein
MAGLSGCNSICRATYCPSKWAYHQPRLFPAVESLPPAELLDTAARINGIRKYRCELVFIGALMTARGTLAAEIKDQNSVISSKNGMIK